jgi:hypothetical protein
MPIIARRQPAGSRSFTRRVKHSSARPAARAAPARRPPGAQRARDSIFTDDSGVEIAATDPQPGEDLAEIVAREAVGEPPRNKTRAPQAAAMQAAAGGQRRPPLAPVGVQIDPVDVHPSGGGASTNPRRARTKPASSAADSPFMRMA